MVAVDLEVQDAWACRCWVRLSSYPTRSRGCLISSPTLFVDCLRVLCSWGVCEGGECERVS